MRSVAGPFRWLTLACPGADQAQLADQGSLPAQRAADAAAKCEPAVNLNRPAI